MPSKQSQMVVAAAALFVLLGALLCPPAWSQQTEEPPPVAEQAPPKPVKPRAVKKFEPPPPALEPEPVPIPPPPTDLLPPSQEPSSLARGDDLIRVLLGRTAEAPPPTFPQVTRAIIGLVILLALAYLGGHPLVGRIEQKFNIGHAVTTGLPFFLLGFVASRPEVGILVPSVLREVGPLLPLGLGWVGFTIGSRFDARAMEKLAPGISTVVFVSIALPFACILAVSLATFWFVRAEWKLELLRDAMLLATAGAMAARSAPQFLRSLLPARQVSERLLRIGELEQLGGVLGIMMIAAYWRPKAMFVAWHLPGTAWLFIAIGIGASLGIVLYALLAKAAPGAQQTTVLLGAVAFTAGIASYLRLAPLAVCFIAGAVTANGGGDFKSRLRDLFVRMERPVYFLFMILAGALWRPGEWQGWVLMAIFVLTRFASKWLTAALLHKMVPAAVNGGETTVLKLAPMGALSVAIVVSAQDLYYGPAVPWIVTAVIAGSLVMEIALQIVIRRRAEATPTAAPLEVKPALGVEVD